MNKKTHKVEETATPYVASPRPAKKEVASGVRQIDREVFQKSAGKVFKKHAGLFRNLAR